MEFRYRTLKVLSILFILSSPVAALADEDDHPFEIEIMGGVNHTNTVGGSINFAEGEHDALHETSSNNDGIWGGGVGYNLSLWDDEEDDDGIFRDLLLGVDILFFNVDHKGDVYQGGLAENNNYDYELELRTSRLMANAELGFFPEWERFYPYIQFSIGGSRVDATYHDTPKPGIPGGNISLPQETDYNFAYSFGAGVKFLLLEELQISLSYLYTDLGDIKTATHPNSADTSDLSNPITGELRTNAFLVGLSYFFG